MYIEHAVHLEYCWTVVEPIISRNNDLVKRICKVSTDLNLSYRICSLLLNNNKNRELSWLSLQFEQGEKKNLMKM